MFVGWLKAALEFSDELGHSGSLGHRWRCDQTKLGAWPLGQTAAISQIGRT